MRFFQCLVYETLKIIDNWSRSSSSFTLPDEDMVLVKKLSKLPLERPKFTNEPIMVFNFETFTIVAYLIPNSWPDFCQIFFRLFNTSPN